MEIGGVTLVYEKLKEEDYTELQRPVDLLDPKNDLDVIVQADRDFHRIISKS